MGLDKNLEYRICFDRVKNLDEVKKDENYVDSIRIDDNLYAITFNPKIKDKKFVKNFVDSFLSEFKDIFYTCLKECKKPLKHYEISKRLDLDIPRKN